MPKKRVVSPDMACPTLAPATPEMASALLDSLAQRAPVLFLSESNQPISCLKGRVIRSISEFRFFQPVH